jgi:aspartate/methionine/tyrosine aminotransferase
MFSRRTAWPRHENALERAVAQAGREGRPVLDLCASNPTRAGLHDQAEGDALLRALAQPISLVYDPHPLGGVEARRAVLDHLHPSGKRPPVEQVCLTASTSEAYAFLFELLCDPGEAVLVPTPSYPLFDYLAGLESVELLPYPLRYDGEWHVDVPALRRAAAHPRVRGVLAIHPNNPTGNYLSRDELSAITELCAERQLAFVCDEVFFDFSLERDARPSRAGHAHQNSPCLTFTLGGLSKSVGWPQLKLGFIIADGPASLLQEALERLHLIADSYLSVGAPIQAALPDVLSHASRFQERVRSRLSKNLALLRDLSAKKPWSVLAVEGGWNAILRVPQTLSSEAWAVKLVDEASVQVQPGYFYDLPESHLVLSLLVPPGELDRGATLLDQVIQSV